MAFVGRSDPGMQRVYGRVHIAVMRRPTHGTRPLPYWPSENDAVIDGKVGFYSTIKQ